MSTALTFFDHSRHTLQIRQLDTPLDVLAFSGEECLSQPFSYRIEFTSTELDLGADQLLGRTARFSLHALPSKEPVMPWQTPQPPVPLRTLRGVVSACQRLSASVDEARYAITLQPRLALLARGRQTRLYQHRSVPEIVEGILRSRHDFLGQDFLFRLVRDYPRREQVIQYEESDLAFIERLLADVGIWYRFTSDERLHIDVVEFCDDQRGYQFDVALPLRPPSGLSSSEQDSVWALQTEHRVVERQVNVRAYHADDARAYLDGEVDQTRGEPAAYGGTNTYGEAYHSAEAYRVLGDAYDQDISSRVSGPILEHLHHNFAKAWRKETREDLFALRRAMQVGPTLQCTPEATRQMAQLVRTQPQEGKRDIEALYLQAVNNATQFIYIENQYFRWPPLAELIKKVAAAQTRGGRDPGLHGSLHLFVITNDEYDAIGAGMVNTQRMLESLGRAETMPEVTKLRRIEAVKAQAATLSPTVGELLEERALLMMTSLTDAMGGTDLSEKAREAQRDAAKSKRWRLEDLDASIRAIESSKVEANLNIPGLKVHVCSLVASNSPAGKWMPVYIHSKLMIVDDVFTTHGSANINTRSMQVDSELNIAHEWASVTQKMRRRLWDLHTNKKGAQDDAALAFKAWQEIITENKKRRGDKVYGVPDTSLVEFYYDKDTMEDLD